MDKFRDYMFYLLPAVLKKNKSLNQFYIFCAVTGQLFDDLKIKMFRLREESMLDTCSDSMLEIAGQDRGMIRMKGESIDNFRKRLKMKAQIAAMAGTKQGILYALKSMGYDNCVITPLYESDPSRWAEINIDFYVESVDDPNEIDFKCIVDSVMNTKKASTLPHYIFHYPSWIKTDEEVRSCTIHRFTSKFFSNVLYLDGSWLLDGSNNLEGSFDNLKGRSIIQSEIKTEETLSGKVIIENDLWYLDGSFILDGTRKLDAFIKEENL